MICMSCIGCSRRRLGLLTLTTYNGKRLIVTVCRGLSETPCYKGIGPQPINNKYVDVVTGERFSKSYTLPSYFE